MRFLEEGGPHAERFAMLSGMMGHRHRPNSPKKRQVPVSGIKTFDKFRQ